MKVLYALRALRTPVTEALGQFITGFGESTVFLTLALALLWCIDRKYGWHMVLAESLGLGANILVKSIARSPRPWVRDPEFTIVESARGWALGYSFPSGHTQSAAQLFGTLAIRIRRRLPTLLCSLAIALVGFSRMLLGVHTPADVLCGLALGLGSAVAIGFVMKRAEASLRAGDRAALILALISAAFTLGVLLLPENFRSDPAFDAEDVLCSWQMLGLSLGGLLAWRLTERFNPYDPADGAWWVQLVKLLGGGAVVMGIRVGMKPVLSALFGPAPFCDAIRYFLVTFVGGFLWPLLFPLMAKWGREADEAEA